MAGNEAALLVDQRRNSPTKLANGSSKLCDLGVRMRPSVASR